MTRKLKDMPHPMQPIGFGEDGQVRFKRNAIVDFLLEAGPFDLNSLTRMCAEGTFSAEDYTHLMQLIGYSVSGYGELSSSPPELVEKADALAKPMWAEARQAMWKNAAKGPEDD